MEREYIKIKKPSPLPNLTHLLNDLDDDFWKKWIFFHLLSFYKTYDKSSLLSKIVIEKEKQYPRVEREIAKFIRTKLNNDKAFSANFYAFGENTNDEDIEGNYDITIHNSYWKNKNFHFECKNLNSTNDLISKYVYYNTYKIDKDQNHIYDGGVFRYFNGKYAQNLSFGGMIGFILEGDMLEIKKQIILKLDGKFKTTPEGDLKTIEDNSIENNIFTFDSNHNRFQNEFNLHHVLLDFSNNT